MIYHAAHKKGVPCTGSPCRRLSGEFQGAHSLESSRISFPSEKHIFPEFWRSPPEILPKSSLNPPEGCANVRTPPWARPQFWKKAGVVYDCRKDFGKYGLKHKFDPQTIGFKTWLLKYFLKTPRSHLDYSSKMRQSQGFKSKYRPGNPFDTVYNTENEFWNTKRYACQPRFKIVRLSSLNLFVFSCRETQNLFRWYHFWNQKFGSVPRGVVLWGPPSPVGGGGGPNRSCTWWNPTFGSEKVP